MPRLQSLETTLKQLNLHDLSPPFTSNHLSDDQTRWENELARLLTIKPPRSHDVTHPSPSSLHPSTPTAQPVTIPSISNTFAATQALNWPFPAQPIPSAPPAPSQPNAPTHCSTQAPPYPASIPKLPHSDWLVHMSCPVAFSPCSPRVTWPWPSWVCDAFETGDVLWYTLGSGAKAHVNIRARRRDLVDYFREVERKGGVVDEGGRGKDEGGRELLVNGKLQDGKSCEKVCARGMARGNKMVEPNDKVAQRGDEKQGRNNNGEIHQLLARAKLGAERVCAKAKAQLDEQVPMNNKIAQRGDDVTELEEGVLQQLEAIQLEAEKLRVKMQGQWIETGEEGMEEWEVLDGVFDEEGWIDVSIEQKIGSGWAMVRRTVPSVGEDGGDGA